ncbi:tellurite resistance TerB family protein [Adhaeribacter radiodurans]|uniref:tellurite resistance TerB family protein n=1 Tax=Adhaeribacter radiodurans TaxID=2745197 RepID=UPI0021D2C653|nr:TerB family tellurite resistance protein [Adhaeribacter radiodurans]
MENHESQLLQNYSENERAAYLGAIASIASADRVASEEEITFLEALAQNTGLSPEQQQSVVQAAQDPSNANVRRYLDQLKNSELRFSLITDIMSFAQADGKLSGEEEKRIQEMAQYLNINQQQYGALHQYVNKASQAQQQGQNPTDHSFLEQTGLANSLGQAGIPTSGLMQGLLGVLAPMVISKVLGGRSGGGMNTGMGGLGGLLDGVLGGSGSMGGLGGLMGGGSTSGGLGGGGLGSLMGVLGGLGKQGGALVEAVWVPF